MIDVMLVVKSRFFCCSDSESGKKSVIWAVDSNLAKYLIVTE